MIKDTIAPKKTTSTVVSSILVLPRKIKKKLPWCYRNDSNTQPPGFEYAPRE